VYETEDKFYVDAIKVGLTEKLYQGAAIEKLDIERHFPWLDHNSQQAEDIERFRWFSNRYLAVDKNFPNRIIDIRYSILPNTIDALWGIDLNPVANSSEHVQFTSNRDTSNRELSRLLEMLFN
jgi:inner membrane protein